MTEETFEGTFYFDNEKQDWYVHFVKPNKKEAVIKCNPKQISPNLPRNKDEKITVKFEADRRYYNDVLNVRLKDEENMPEDYKKELETQQKQENEASANRPPRLEGNFHNPYNFVPAIPRDISHPELGDDKPCGHDRYLDDKFSGKLTVKMTVETPLVILDTARVEVQGDHKKFPVRIENGKPFINPTAVKGMLRSAYEVITNSRMSVFTKHDERLAFRAEVGEGLYVIPARIEGTKIVFYTGTSSPQADGKPQSGHPMYAAWTRMYETNNFRMENGEKVFAMSSSRISLKNTAGDNPKYPNKAWAWIEEFKHRTKPFRYWKVMEIAYDQAHLSTSFPKTIDSVSTSPKKVEGYICNTGKTMKSKHDERFFFGKNSTYDIDLEQHHIDVWNNLIKNYREQHENDFDSPPKEKVKYGVNDGAEYSLEWSRHIQRTTKEETSEKANLIDEELKDGTLCYARVKQNGATFEVIELFPVMISRRLHQNSPADLLDENLKPASIIEEIKDQDGTIKYKSEMSPADRVFGIVRHKRKDSNGKDIKFKGKIEGYRGQIRFGSVNCNGLLEDDGNGGKVLNPNGETIQYFNDLPLNILGQPKPQQGRFYVAKNKGGDAQVDGLNNENAGYNLPSVKGLRGRKVYPHHANWTIQNNLKEYQRPDRIQDSQNRSIEGWITPQTKFTFDIHFTNLSEVELGALVWLLQLSDKHFHRFGGGKPYGFGSVKLEIIESDVRDGKDLESFYMSLDDEKIGKLDENAIKKLADDFKKLADSMFPTIIKSFLCACEGFADKPTHYPRKSPHLTADTKSFEWFVENNRIDRGTVKNGYVLQDLADDEGLPYLS